jgi:hypothetical protein
MSDARKRKVKASTEHTGWTGFSVRTRNLAGIALVFQTALWQG